MQTISARFLRDHEALRRTLDELGNAAEGANAATLVDVWTDFERRLERHLETEERLLLPGLRLRHREEAQLIQREHDQIRALVGELGIRADLHTLRKDVVDELIALLVQHADREERGLYAWADRELSAAGLSEDLWNQAGSVV